jgi:hypothetical protein
MSIDAVTRGSGTSGTFERKLKRIAYKIIL